MPYFSGSSEELLLALECTLITSVMYENEMAWEIAYGKSKGESPENSTKW